MNTEYRCQLEVSVLICRIGLLVYRVELCIVASH